MSFKLIKGKASFARVINMQLSLEKRQFSRLREFPETNVRVFIRVQQNLSVPTLKNLNKVRCLLVKDNGRGTRALGSNPRSYPLLSYGTLDQSCNFFESPFLLIRKMGK